MTFNRKSLTALLLAVLTLFLFTGCSAAAQLDDIVTGLLTPSGAEDSFTPQQAEGLCIIAARRANTRWPDSMPDALHEDIRAAFAVYYDADYGRYCAEASIPVIVSDGSPDIHRLEYSLTGNSTANLYMQLDEAVEEILTRLAGPACAANDEGADLLAALSEARAADPAIRKFAVIDSGITVSGYLNMAVTDIMAGEAADVIAAIDPAAFPSLDGYGISFYNLGNVCGTQDAGYRTSNAYRQRLEQLWSGILTDRCGAELAQPIAFAASGGTEQLYSEDAEGLPWVAPAVFAVNIESAARDVYSIPASGVGFLPDSAEFRDPAVAQQVIEAAAAWLKDYFDTDPAGTVYVAGSIARPAPDSDLPTSAVSLARAQAVAQLLQAGGVDADRLVIVDTGTRRGSWSESVEFEADGTPIAAAREHNRQVVLIPSGSEQAAELAAMLP